MARKKINIITPHYTPEITAAAHRMESLAISLSASFEVNVFTLSERGMRRGEQTIRERAHLTVHTLKTQNYNKSLFISRAFWELWYAFKLARKANKAKASLTIVTIPFMFLLPVVARFCKSGKIVADVRDLVWHYLPGRTVYQRYIRSLLERVMHSALRKFDAITVTNHAEAHWLSNQGRIDSNNITVIPNGIPEEKFRMLSDIRYVPHPNKFTITYAGNIGTSQEFLSLIDVVSKMNSIRLNLIGDGNELQLLRTHIRKNKITNVFFPGKQKWMRLLPYYQTSNVLFASLKNEYDTAIPSKLYEYMATGLPVMYIGGGSAAHFLRQFKNVFILTHSSPEAIEKMIWDIKRLSPQRSWKNRGIIGRYFLREKVSLRYVELCASLLNEKTLSRVFIEDLLE